MIRGGEELRGEVKRRRAGGEERKRDGYEERKRGE